jgi:gingipain R
MKKIILLFACILCSTFLFAKKSTQLSVISESAEKIIVELSLGEIQKNTIATPRGSMLSFSFDDCSYFNKKGAPSLPIYAKSIIIPNKHNGVLKVLDVDFVEYKNIEIVPSKGPISRNQNPDDIQYVFGKEYETNEMFPLQSANLNTPFIFRDYRGQAVQFNPFQYNAVSKTLTVCSRMKVEIVFSEVAEPNLLSNQAMPSTQIVEEFDGMYRNLFLNYASKKATRYTPITQIGSLLIVCPNKYMSAILPFMKWKEMKGIKTYLVDADTIAGGVSEASITQLAQFYYTSKQIAYMQIVGDNTDIPARNDNDSPASFFKGPSDMGYAYISNGDHRPEFIVGRFSGESVADIQTQVKRTLDYEKNPNTTDNWKSTQIGIGSLQGPQQNDDNQIDYQHIHDIVDSNKNQYNYLTNVEMYDGVPAQAGTDLAGYPNATMLTTAINSGASLLNYCGHGYSNGIVTCGFNINNVADIDNAEKLPFFFIVGCQPGNFINQTSFAEKCMRHGGATPKGTISAYMSTIDQWLDGPMESQDEFNAVMRGARPSNLKNRLGAMCVSGSLAMLDKYDISSDPFGGSEMMDTWIFFGDPTVALFNKFEGTLSVTNTAHVMEGETSLAVNCAVNDATIGLYYKGKYLSSAIVSGGVANCQFPPITGEDTIFITATKQNYAPGYGYTQKVSWPQGLDEKETNNLINVYPNPATKILFVETNDQTTIEKVIIKDLSGRTILAKSINANACKIDLTDVASGVYFMQLQTAKGLFSTKFRKD